MKIADIYNHLDIISPFDTQEAWDNSGLLVGSMQNEVDELYLALDLSSQMIEKASKNSLFITHHPLIFKGLKAINDTYPSNLLKKLIEKNISLISLHTNYDKSHLNEYFIKEILGFEITYKEGFLAYIEADFSFLKLGEFLKKRLNLSILRGGDSGKHIRKIAVCVGSGGDLLGEVRADCFLSGDIKYHQAFEARANKLSFFDLGHFESERYFASSLAKNLQILELNCIICEEINPFIYV